MGEGRVIRPNLSVFFSTLWHATLWRTHFIRFSSDGAYGCLVNNGPLKLYCILDLWSPLIEHRPAEKAVDQRLLLPNMRVIRIRFSGGYLDSIIEDVVTGRKIAEVKLA